MDELGSASAYTFADINGIGTDYKEMNKGVTPVFFVEPVKDERASEAAGAPRFIELERVRIIVAGDMLNIAVHPVDDQIKERFAEQYERWKSKRQDSHIEGTPLKQWPPLSASQVMEMNALNIRSVEDLASVSDVNISRIPDGRQWREKAKAWLETAKDGATAMRFAAENERLKDDMAELRKTVEELSARLSEEKRGPGRPPKVAA